MCATTVYICLSVHSSFFFFYLCCILLTVVSNKDHIIFDEVKAYEVKAYKKVC